MDAFTLLQNLFERDLDVRLDTDGRLLVTPGNILTDHDRANIRANLPALKRLVSCDYSTHPKTRESQPMNRAAILPQAEPRDESTPPKMPEIVTASSYQNAELIQKIKGVSEDKIGVFDLAQQIESRARVVADGDLCHVEMGLVSQAASLETLYSNLIDRALRSKEMAHIEAFFRLGLRAQNQCRATLETLATIKNPPVIFAKQANLAGGHMQINNAPAHGKSETVPNELLTENQPTKAIGEVKHERLDTGAPGTASGIDSSMATVGEIDRGTLPRGQGKGINPNKLLKLARKDLKAADEALRGYMDTLKTKETTQ